MPGPRCRPGSAKRCRRCPSSWRPPTVALGVERATTDAVEAASLADRVGEEFAAVVVDVPEGKDDGGALEVQLVDPPVLARAKGAAELGAEVTVRLTGVSLDEGRVDFEVA
nr:hypothetical protein [Janibacter hoylei]